MKTLGGLLVLLLTLGVLVTRVQAQDCDVNLQVLRPSYYAINDNCTDQTRALPAGLSVSYEIQWKKSSDTTWTLAFIHGPSTAESMVVNIPNLPCDVPVDVRVGAYWPNGTVLCYSDSASTTISRPAPGPAVISFP